VIVSAIVDQEALTFPVSHDPAARARNRRGSGTGGIPSGLIRTRQPSLRRSMSSKAICILIRRHAYRPVPGYHYSHRNIHPLKRRNNAAPLVGMGGECCARIALAALSASCRFQEHCLLRLQTGCCIALGLCSNVGAVTLSEEARTHRSGRHLTI
jgi:hypothetical protein